jgi:hypothetical protein
VQSVSSLRLNTGLPGAFRNKITIFLFYVLANKFFQILPSHSRGSAEVDCRDFSLLHHLVGQRLVDSQLVNNFSILHQTYNGNWNGKVYCNESKSLVQKEAGAYGHGLGNRQDFHQQHLR